MNPFAKESKQLSIFVTAGYPKIDSLGPQLQLLSSKGVDFVEVGIPFSDPLADGPVIQETSAVALENGMNLKLLFDQLKSIEPDLPLVLMGYLNPVMAYGLKPFLKDCQECDIQAVILPDLSPEIYERFYQNEFTKYGVSPVLLITPSSTEDRIRNAAKLCSNSFVYLVSSHSITGGASTWTEEQLKSFESIVSKCGNTPVFIGFGIRTKDDIRKVHSVCNGAIIGSAYLKA